MAVRAVAVKVLAVTVRAVAVDVRLVAVEAQAVHVRVVAVRGVTVRAVCSCGSWRWRFDSWPSESLVCTCGRCTCRRRQYERCKLKSSSTSSASSIFDATTSRSSSTSAQKVEKAPSSSVLWSCSAPSPATGTRLTGASGTAGSVQRPSVEARGAPRAAVARKRRVGAHAVGVVLGQVGPGPSAPQRTPWGVPRGGTGRQGRVRPPASGSQSCTAQSWTTFPALAVDLVQRRQAGLARDMSGQLDFLRAKPAGDFPSVDLVH